MPGIQNAAAMESDDVFQASLAPPPQRSGESQTTSDDCGRRAARPLLPKPEDEDPVCLAEDEGSRWVGRILATHACGFTVFIGPHWYFSVVMLCLILGIGVMYTVNVAWRIGLWQTAGGCIVTVISAWTFLRCFVQSPGILRRQSATETEAEPESGESAPLRSRRCDICKVPQPRGVQHCDFCGVCVLGHDHHCPWMGKCIGQGNIHAFYVFIVSGFSSLFYIFIVTLLSAPDGPPPQRGYYG